VLLNDHRILGAIAGGLGGAASWLLIEPIVAPQLARVTSVAELYPLDALFGALAGICIGAALGVAEGLVVRSAYRARRGGLIGALAGILGGAIGLVVGEIVYQPLKLLCFVGRSLGWAVFGAFLGTAEGITRRSWRGVRSAALGGIVGGAIGGFMFDLVGFVMLLMSGSDGLSRGVALTILGACIGLWIVLLERILAPARLKITSGQFEGREFVLDKPLLTLGSDERGDVAIFGDPQVAARHATLQHEGQGYILKAEPGQTFLVNKQPVSRHALQHEDELVIGQTRLIYRVKSDVTARATSRLSAATQAGSYASPQASSVVPMPVAPISPVSVARPQAPPGAKPGGVWLADQRTGRHYSLAAGMTMIGRAGDNQIVLDLPSVSGHHAEIHYENDRYILYDCESSNGTYVNGRRITGANLIKPGWRIQFGDAEFVVGGG
jgi:pSer/pThr/pTyr-binding forkhead associated (FHA) protein